MKITIDGQFRVAAQVTQRLPLPARVAWGQMRDWRRFLTLDPLHQLIDSAPGECGKLLITHRFLGLKVVRVGRIVRWRENAGFVVSDLSRRGPRAGFPHVCIYEIKPTGSEESCITIGVRGRWTANWVPRPVIRAWIWWILASTRAHIRREFHLFCRWRSTSLSVLPRP